MRLTTDMRVWKALILIAITLSLFFYLFFYFSYLSVTFLIGLALIILTKRIANDYSIRICRYDYPRWKCRTYGILLIIFWVLIALLIVSRSVYDMGELLNSVANEDQTMTERYIAQAEHYLPEFITSRISAKDIVGTAEGYILGLLTDLLEGLTYFVINAVLIIPLMFYVYYRKWDRLRSSIFAMVPERFDPQFRKAAYAIAQKLNEFLTAKVLESTIIASLCCLGFYVAGLRGWLVLGVFAGFLNIIPYIGPLIGAIPPILIGLLDEPIVALYALITIIIVQLIDNLYLIPFMISGKVRVDALLGIFITLIGAQLAGPLGMILGIPIYLVFRITLTESYKALVLIYR